MSTPTPLFWTLSLIKFRVGVLVPITAVRSLSDMSLYFQDMGYKGLGEAKDMTFLLKNIANPGTALEFKIHPARSQLFTETPANEINGKITKPLVAILGRKVANSMLIL